MSLKLVVLFLGLAGVAGLGIGYYLRLIIALGKKGSMELKIKEMDLTAKEEAKKVLEEAETEGKKLIEKSHQEIKEKESKIQQIETRLIKKEDFLDKRQ
ncbi:MAG: Rnase Y domain-containing protein, partial [Patescibacteria group bacterium]